MKSHNASKNHGRVHLLKRIAKKAFATCGLEVRWAKKDIDLALSWPQRLANTNRGQFKPASSSLEEFFESHTEGPGIWKWRHYFEIYHRHFCKFVGKDVHVLEIGVYSGGSLGMWKHYFGPQAKIYGVDIEPACKAYEDEQTKILIGDQADPFFWKRTLQEIPQLDIVIDDGGHQPHQQIATVEALLPHLRPHGAFLCEDITTEGNPFFDYVCKFTNHLNAFDCYENYEDSENRLRATPTSLQHAIHSVHFYPFVAVIERRAEPLNLVAPKHGTSWQPFL
jgi:Methyltransferase domain